MAQLRSCERQNHGGRMIERFLQPGGLATAVKIKGPGYYVRARKLKQGGHKINQTILANRFEVTVKTAQRDIDFARDRLLMPIEYDSSAFTYRLIAKFTCPTCGHKQIGDTTKAAV